MLLLRYLGSNFFNSSTPAFKSAKNSATPASQSFKALIVNPSCDLPKEIDATSEYKESDLDFKTSGGDSMNGFW
jgi:hypothetical protein